MAADLQALVSSADIRPPYVLVGHSIGGIVVRRCYAQHPGMVAGIVLVDSSHEQQVPRIGVQDELAALSTDSKPVSAQEAGHYVHLDRPDLVIQAILDLVRRCR